MEIKRRLDKEEFAGFIASNGWLDSWKQTYEVREKRLYGEADEVSTTTTQAWIEWLTELYEDSKPLNILNFDELGLIFKALPEKGLSEKTKKSKGGKKSKQRMTIMLLLLLMVLLSLNQLSFGDQNYHVPLSPLKMHQDWCPCITFWIKRLRWTRTLWRVFYRD